MHLKVSSDFRLIGIHLTCEVYLVKYKFKKINANRSEKTVWHKAEINYIKPKFKILEVGKDADSFTCPWTYKSIMKCRKITCQIVWGKSENLGEMEVQRLI